MWYDKSRAATEVLLMYCLYIAVCVLVGREHKVIPKLCTVNARYIHAANDILSHRTEYFKEGKV